jgi:hypothetical protein
MQMARDAIAATAVVTAGTGIAIATTAIGVGTVAGTAVATRAGAIAIAVQSAVLNVARIATPARVAAPNAPLPIVRSSQEMRRSSVRKHSRALRYRASPESQARRKESFPRVASVVAGVAADVVAAADAVVHARLVEQVRQAALLLPSRGTSAAKASLHPLRTRRPQRRQTTATVSTTPRPQNASGR